MTQTVDGITLCRVHVRRVTTLDEPVCLLLLTVKPKHKIVTFTNKDFLASSGIKNSFMKMNVSALISEAFLFFSVGDDRHK